MMMIMMIAMMIMIMIMMLLSIGVQLCQHITHVSMSHNPLCRE